MRARIGDHVTLERSSAVAACLFDGYELVEKLLGVALYAVASRIDALDGLDAPKETEIVGKDAAHLVRSEHLLDLVAIFGESEADERVVAHLQRHEVREERDIIGLGKGICGHSVIKEGSSRVGWRRERVGLLLRGGHECTGSIVGLNELWQDLAVGVGLPELKACGALEDALRVGNTRELDHHTSGLLETLDVRLCDAETVDTGSEDVESVLDGALSLLAEDCDDLTVRHLEVDPVFHVDSGENGGELAVGVELLELLAEEGDKVGRGVLLTLNGILNGLVEDRVGVVVGDSLNDIRNLDFENKVHTALEVKAEVDLLALALHIGETEVDGLIGDRVQIGGLDLRVSGRSLLGSALHMSRDKREGQLVQTHQRQEDGEYPYGSFVLHLRLVYVCATVFCVVSYAMRAARHRAVSRRPGIKYRAKIVNRFLISLLPIHNY